METQTDPLPFLSVLASRYSLSYPWCQSRRVPQYRNNPISEHKLGISFDMHAKNGKTTDLDHRVGNGACLS
jgi:hypothetical protein